uniref:Uncharacterized protein n=1 Tax=Oryza punctata TaxID=4537 RepID=A0A0E0JIM2_ORYPU
MGANEGSDFHLFSTNLRRGSEGGTRVSCDGEQDSDGKALPCVAASGGKHRIWGLRAWIRPDVAGGCWGRSQPRHGAAGPGQGHTVIRVGKRESTASLWVGGPAGAAVAKPLAPLCCLKASRDHDSLHNSVDEALLLKSDFAPCLDPVGFSCGELHATALAELYDSYVPDLLHFGDSSSPSPNRSTRFQAACIAAALRRLGVEWCTVVGACCGVLRAAGSGVAGTMVAYVRWHFGYEYLNVDEKLITWFHGSKLG